MKELSGNWSVETFDSEIHERKNFSCGVLGMDGYFKNYATQDIKRNLTRMYVLINQDSKAVAGYYCLSATSFDKNSAPSNLAKRLPHYPIPAVLLGRLAVDSTYQNCGLGSNLLMDAFKKVIQVNEIIGIVALLVDAIDSDAVRFYQKAHFLQFSDDDLQLFLSVKKIQNLLN